MTAYVLKGAADLSTICGVATSAPRKAQAPRKHTCRFGCLLTATYLVRVCFVFVPALCRLQFMNNVYSATTARTGFSAVVTSTATKRAGYTYVNTGGSAWNTIPSTTLFPVETGLVADATLC